MEAYKLTYKNHINETVEFGVNGLWFVGTELHDYAWSYTANNGKIENFNRGIVEKKINVVIACKTKAQGINYMNQIIECSEKDILDKIPGTLYFGGYYLKCYLTKSKKSKFIERKGYIEIELTVLTDSPSWIKETIKSFSKSSSGTGGKNLDYAFDFPYDFTSPSAVQKLVNTGFSDTDFKLIVFGEVTNPSIYIGGNLYEVNCYVANGQYLTIDSKNKTITITKINGELVNHFKDRNKDNYIFTKIRSGEVPVSWIGEYSFEITLYEERSEPKWT